MSESSPLLVASLKVGEFEGRNLYLRVVCLNAPRSLNALTLEMVDQLYQYLLEWQSAEEVVGVFLHGAGEKAFCAGGDIRALYQSMKDVERPCEEADQFFCREYRLDYLISQYKKPIICMGDGLVMGGGLGLMAASQIRLVTATSKLAMPEITIGLFPDVGGTWFLNQMPSGVGLFLGLTGAPLNAADAKAVGLADYYVGTESAQALLHHLQQVQWTTSSSQNKNSLGEFFASLEKNHTQVLKAGRLARYEAFWSILGEARTVGEAVQLISDQQVDDPWFEKACGNLLKGSPFSAGLVFWQLSEGKYLSRAEGFRQELVFACQCVRLGEFEEGVRALIVDKDNNPVWQLVNFEAVTESQLAPFFVPPWADGGHPLEDLESVGIK